MPMGTTDQPNRNAQMAPAPTGNPMPPPGWAGTQDVEKPFLPEEFDRVLLMRCYPDVNSTDELRAKAYAVGAQVMEMAAASISSQQAELQAQEEQQDKPAPKPPPPAREAHHEAEQHDKRDHDKK